MKKDIRNLYIKTLGFSPYEYQVKMSELLLSGKNVILSVPTGAGKTWASIIPFLLAKQKNSIHFPPKLIYSLPLRSLTNSIYHDVSEKTDASIQTGEYSEDKYFEKDIVFTTIDQTLSNFLCFPLALSQRQANINAGALIGRYLVFDEFHLLDNDLSMATTIGMLKMLENLCRCCIMTATLSNDFKLLLKSTLHNFEIITLDDFPEDKGQIGSLQPQKQKKRIEVVEEVISAQQIVERHQSKTIVLCNRVETAQSIYRDVVGLSGSIKHLNQENIICLHSRFFDNDRKGKEEKLKELFGKEADENEQAILIATQVIEAGMDISCDIMHTEISPVHSFIQRAGRCARFENERGKIFTYNILDVEEIERVEIEPTNEEDKKEIRRLNNKYLPYDKVICQAAFNELKKYDTLDGDIPQKLIEDILGDEEKKIIKRLETGQGGGFNQAKIRESWSTCEKNLYRNTIRDIQSVEITLINDEMVSEIPKKPYHFQTLGMYKWSLVSWLNRIWNGKGVVSYDKEDWLVKKLSESNFIDIENDEEINYELERISDFQSLPSKVYLNAKYFGYSGQFGFNWQYPNTFNITSPKKEHREDEERFEGFRKDTFYQHNTGLLRCFEKEFQDELDFTFTELSRYIGLSKFQKGDFIKLIKLMIILHDYGKLNEDWQKPMQTYQALKEGIDAGNLKEILGHTDYDPNDEMDKKLSEKAKLDTRPAHAGVGAFVALSVLGKTYKSKEEFLKILSPLATSIMRHHSPQSSNVSDFNIPKRNFKKFVVLYEEQLSEFKHSKYERLLGFKQQKLDGYLANPQNTNSILMYFFLVRILRMCDQKATKDLECYLQN